MVIGRKALLVIACWSLGWLGSAPATADVLSPLPRTNPAATELAAAVARLRSLCAPLWGELPVDCMAELDSFYLDRDVTLNSHSDLEHDPSKMSGVWRPRPVDDAIVWRDLFGDPLALRDAVERAAADTQCHATGGQEAHHLRQVCAADAFARLSVLLHACARALHWDGSERHGDWNEKWRRERRTLDESIAQHADSYVRRTATLDESELHFAWRLRKCRAVPPAAMERVVSVRMPPVEFHDYSQSLELMVLANRLGSPWANTRVGNSFSVSGAEMNATAKSNIVLAYVRRAVKATGVSRLWHLAYLLAAREYDLRGDAPQLDWSELQWHFSKAEIEDAWPTVQRLLRRGWQPMKEEERDTWPWATAPPVVEYQFIRRRLDQDGNMRWVYEDGRQEWLGKDNGLTRLVLPDGSYWGVFHSSRLSDRRLPNLRSWVDADGRSRWLDSFGREHWIDADGAEHWVDYGGTEWILLPPEVPSSAPNDHAGEGDTPASGGPTAKDARLSD